MVACAKVEVSPTGVGEGEAHATALQEKDFMEEFPQQMLCLPMLQHPGPGKATTRQEESSVSGVGICRFLCAGASSFLNRIREPPFFLQPALSSPLSL